MIRTDLRHCGGMYDENVFAECLKEARSAMETLVGGTGRGSEMTGWIKLPSSILASDVLDRYAALAERWKKAGIEVVVSVGVGGSYLGSKAAVEALGHTFMDSVPGYPRLVYAGHNLSEDYLADLSAYLEDKSFAVIVISKSGTTTEPAVAFRFLKAILEDRYGKEGAAERIAAVTDASKGALRTMADKEGYVSFIVPDNVGGRFSVLTPAGLLPLAVAGYDVRSMVVGAAAMEAACADEEGSSQAVMYSAYRNMMYRSGRKIEMMINYDPRLVFVSEWWKQLFGESEGKEGKGIFPASATYTTDLHSMGQYVQDGERILMETLVSVKESCGKVTVPYDAENLDGLNYLSGRTVGECNLLASDAVAQAHVSGRIPTFIVEIDRLCAYTLGELFYFFEFACGISGYMLGVNPFDQPGVEQYKTNMYRLLGKPGYSGK